MDSLDRPVDIHSRKESDSLPTASPPDAERARAPAIRNQEVPFCMT